MSKWFTKLFGTPKIPKTFAEEFDKAMKMKEDEDDATRNS